MQSEVIFTVVKQLSFTLFFPKAIFIHVYFVVWYNLKDFLFFLFLNNLRCIHEEKPRVELPALQPRKWGMYVCLDYCGCIYPATSLLARTPKLHALRFLPIPSHPFCSCCSTNQQWVWQREWGGPEQDADLSKAWQWQEISHPQQLLPTGTPVASWRRGKIAISDSVMPFLGKTWK